MLLNEEVREKLFQEHGVRWSELWQLPYWDPTRQLTVDSMHCIFEGLVSFHFRDVLKLTVESATAKHCTPPAFAHVFRQPFPLGHPDHKNQPPHKQMNENEIKHVSSIHTLLTATLEGGNNAEAVKQSLQKLAMKLTRKNKKPLMFVCEDLGLLPQILLSSTKQYYADILVQWVCIDLLISQILFDVTILAEIKTCSTCQ
jgi:hypothetical protein